MEDYLGQRSYPNFSMEVSQDDGSIEKDESWVWDKFVNGDHKCLIYIYRKYADLLYTYGCQFTTQSELVRDCIQDLFITLIDKRGNLSKVRTLKAYLFASLKRKLLRAVRKEKKWVSEDERFNFYLAETPIYITNNLTEDDREIVFQQLNQLTVNQREVVYLHFYEGLSYSEIAEVMEIKEGNVRVLVHRALIKLKSKLTPFLKSFYSLLLIIPNYLIG